MERRLLILLVAAAAQAAPGAAIQRAADEILRHQTSDGAIVMGTLPARRSHLIPYCANFAAIGLISAFRETGDPRCLDGATKWVGWYEKHQNADGTIDDYDGAPAGWHSTGRYDSSDSYAATFLELLRCIDRAEPDSEWLKSRRPAARKAVAAIRLTLQTNGLTFATPKWHVMYLMDNVETARGLRAAADLGLGTSALAAAMERAITDRLWDEARGLYAVGLEKNGRKVNAPESWYPLVMANLMAAGWLPAKTAPRPRLETLQQISPVPASIRTEEDLDHVVWWGFAARGAGDRALSLEIRRKLEAFDAVTRKFTKPNLLGHLCRLCSKQNGEAMGSAGNP